MPSSGVQTCARSEEHTSELQSHDNLVCRLLLEKSEITSTGKQSGMGKSQWEKVSVRIPARSRPFAAMGSRTTPSFLFFFKRRAPQKSTPFPPPALSKI